MLLAFVSEASAFTTSAASQEKPQITIRIDGSKPYPGDSIDSTPRIEVTATSTNTVSVGSLKIGSLAVNLTFTGAAGRFYSTYEVAAALPDGSHLITVEASDNFNNVTTFEISPLYIQSAGNVTVQGLPLSYPNPFDPGSQNANIGYNLSKPANITLNIYDLAGNLAAKKSYPANQTGGRAGYNEVAWDGKTDSGTYVGNGIYIYVLIADGALAQNGRGKLTVFKR